MTTPTPTTSPTHQAGSTSHAGGPTVEIAGTATFGVQDWQEEKYDGHDGLAATSRAEVAVTYEGELAATGRIVYLLAYPTGYPEQAPATYSGLERVTGSLAGRDGAFLLQHTGTDDGTAATSTWTVVEGSGSGALSGVTGSGSMRAGRDGDFSLTYRFVLTS
jgi:hypothetical protein